MKNDVVRLLSYDPIQYFCFRGKKEEEEEMNGGRMKRKDVEKRENAKWLLTEEAFSKQQQCNRNGPVLYICFH